MQVESSSHKRELVTWAIAIITLINAFMVWLAASGDYPTHETATHQAAAAPHGAMPAPAHGETAPLAGVQPEHAASGHNPTMPEATAMPAPAAPAVMAPHGVELRPMAEPGGLPPALETEKH